MRAGSTRSGGLFVEVFVSTSLAICAERDVKGLYKKAAAGLIDLTGVNHPYEMPESSELAVDGGSVPPEVAVEYIVGVCGRQYSGLRAREREWRMRAEFLIGRGYLLPSARAFGSGVAHDLAAVSAVSRYPRGMCAAL